MITRGAAQDLRDIAADSNARWGPVRAKAYIQDLRAGIQFIADRPEAIPGRSRLTGTSGLRLHRVRNRYIAFKPVTADRIAITSILHERMDVTTHLNALQSRTESDLGTLRAMLLRDLYKR